MQLTISCDLFYRFAQIPLILDPGEKVEFQCLTFHIDNGHAFVIATNVSTCAIQYLGTTTDPDEIISVSIRDAQTFIDQCEAIIEFGGMVTITGSASLGFVSVISSTGQMLNNAMIPTDERIAKWRETLLPEKLPTKSRGGMYWNTDYMIRLAIASTSGQLLFQEHIDNSLPVIITDKGDENWLGVFMGSLGNGETVTIAKIPGWVR